MRGRHDKRFGMKPPLMAHELPMRLDEPIPGMARRSAAAVGYSGKLFLK